MTIMKDILPWRDPKITRKLRLTLLEAELAMRNEELAILRGNSELLDQALDVNSELTMQQGDIQTLIRVRLAAARRLIREDLPVEAEAVLADLVEILKPPRPPKKIV